jgi:hypothetical protein
MPLSAKPRLVPRKSRAEKQQERTEQIAYKLYRNRLLLGKLGDADSDWKTAEEIVRNRLRSILFACHQPFIELEKNISEPLLTWANNQAWLSLLGIIGNVGIIIAVVTYVGSEKQRRDTEVLNAWQTITSAHGLPGIGGRIQALEFLNASPGANWRRKFPWFCAPLPLCTWPAESLDGINLAVEPMNNIVLYQQTTSPDNNDSTPKFQEVYLRGIQLPRARLSSANLQGAILRDTNLQRTDLRDANLQEKCLWNANLQEARGITQSQLIQAKLCGTMLPDGIALDSNRDCQELGIDLESEE